MQGTLGMKNERVIRLLLEMLELDSSEYVRLMVSTAQILELDSRLCLSSVDCLDRELNPFERHDGLDHQNCILPDTE